MKCNRKIILIIIFFIVLTAGRLIAGINTFTPAGTIRYECLIHGHIFSAVFLQAKEIRAEADGKAVYKTIFAVPYEKATAAHLDIWYITKNKNNTYSAVYGGG